MYNFLHVLPLTCAQVFEEDEEHMILIFQKTLARAVGFLRQSFRSVLQVLPLCRAYARWAFSYPSARALHRGKSDSYKEVTLTDAFQAVGTAYLTNYAVTSPESNCRSRLRHTPIPRNPPISCRHSATLSTPTQPTICPRSASGLIFSTVG